MLDREQNPFPPGTVAHQLWTATKSAQPITRASAPSARKRIETVRATGAGESRPHAGSRRRAVLEFVCSRENGTATLAEIDAHFGEPCRGHVQKLIEKNHLELAQ